MLLSYYKSCWSVQIIFFFAWIRIAYLDGSYSLLQISLHIFRGKKLLTSEAGYSYFVGVFVRVCLFFTFLDSCDLLHSWVYCWGTQVQSQGCHLQIHWLYWTYYYKMNTICSCAITLKERKEELLFCFEHVKYRKILEVWFWKLPRQKWHHPEKKLLWLNMCTNMPSDPKLQQIEGGGASRLYALSLTRSRTQLFCSWLAASQEEVVGDRVWLQHLFPSSPKGAKGVVREAPPHYVCSAETGWRGCSDEGGEEAA